MSDDLTFGVAIKGTGDGSMVTEAKVARDELVNLKQAADDLAASSAKLNKSATEDFSALQRSANESAQAWMKGNAAADAAADKAYALANGYKEVDGQLIKAIKSTEEATHMNAGMSRELMVIGHEAVTGNFSKIPGSLMVLANRSGMAASGMVGLGAAMAAPIVALGALAVAMNEGKQEMEAMNRALELTSGYSGQTTSSLYTLAHSLSDTTQLTIGESKNLAMQLASSGKIGAESFDSVAIAITSYARVSGENIDKVAPKLLKTFEDPIKGAIELNKTMHFLNASELERIDTLQRTGHLSEAQNYLAESLNVHLVGQTESVGLLAGAWHGLGKAASSAWDAMMSVGRKDTLDEQIKSAKELLLSAANTGNMDAIQRRQLDLAALLAEKKKQVAEADQTAATANKITDEIEISNIAKQNSELWKKYEVKLKLQRLGGDDAGPAPSADAVKQDAVSKLSENKDLTKLLEQSKKFDEQLVESHKTAFEKTTDAWVAMEAKLTAAGAAGAAARKVHEASFTQAFTDETNKRDAAAAKEEAAKAKHLATQMASENAYFAQRAAAAGRSDNSAEAREQKRYADEVANFQRRYAQAVNDHALLLEEEQSFQTAMGNITQEHENNKFEIGKASGMRQLAQAGTQFRAMFELNKAVRTVEAIVDGYAAIQKAYVWGSTWGGPIGGAASAVVAAAATAANVMAIQGAQFGGGTGAGGAGGGSGGAPVTTPSPIAPPSPAPQQNQTPGGVGTAAQAATQINLTILGAKENPDKAILSYNSLVNDFLPLLQQAKDKGHLVDFNLVAA